jgi:hypothetical protein
MIENFLCKKMLLYSSTFVLCVQNNCCSCIYCRMYILFIYKTL